ncbi:glycosyltransferase family 4 protein [Geobacter argillaceus]|uniref:Glycosyltransferase involved in cell wall biosynthesis n=1 Tax=Geobacter argillaceus TaxID=345631 RepID=A0A562V627_9BACT|nr:glycosyltransferase family 4 protein [Geobacter argillaceus]TWJ13381.1 glycosyltransferase involved in cell wall biosynthesis [Geobacter argillaceus]
MKIVFLAPFGIRPKGTVIARMLPLAAELQQLGHRVTIVTPPYTNPEDSGKEEVVRGVLLRNVRLGPRSKALSALALSWRLFRAALDEKPDLVHLFKPKGYAGFAAMLLLLLRRLGLRLPPVVLDTDDWEGRGGMNDLLDYSLLEKRLFAAQEQWLLRNAAAVTVASRGLEEQAGGMGIPPEQLLYLPNCVAAVPKGNGAAVRERLGIGQEAPVVLLYTRFFEFEQQRLYRVFGEVWRRLPAVRFLVVGKGRRGEEGELLAAGRAGGFAEALLLAGWVDPAELPDYLAAGDVAIYPFADNLVNRCKCPAKLTELLMAEKAVVGDRVGQVAEYVRDGVSGLLCAPGDWEVMTARTVELLRDREGRQALGKAGRQYLLEHYNWRDYSGQLERFYREHVNR